MIGKQSIASNIGERHVAYFYAILSWHIAEHARTAEQNFSSLQIARSTHHMATVLVRWVMYT